MEETKFGVLSRFVCLFLSRDYALERTFLSREGVPVSSHMPLLVSKLRSVAVGEDQLITSSASNQQAEKRHCRRGPCDHLIRIQFLSRLPQCLQHLCLLLRHLRNVLSELGRHQFPCASSSSRRDDVLLPPPHARHQFGCVPSRNVPEGDRE